jgi:hypothetical protein
MLPQDAMNAIERFRAGYAQPLSQRGDLPLPSFFLRTRPDTIHAGQTLPSLKRVTVQPQQVTQRSRIALIGLVTLSLLRLNQYDLSAARSLELL